MSNDLSPGGASSLNAAQILAKLTGATALAAGAMPFGSGSALLTTLPASTNGYFLSLVAGAPAWVPSPSGALPASYAIGDTLYASSASALSRLAAVAVGQVLISAGVGIAPAWSASPLFTGSVTAKPTTTAGIALDPNAATGNFTLSLSPANITAARRWSFPDRSDTVAGLGAQTFTGIQNIGDGTAFITCIANGSTSGATGGAWIGVANGGATVIGIGNKSALIGGGYNNSPYIFGSATITTTVGLNIGGVTTVTDSTDATSLIAASAIFAGGVAVTKQLRVGDTLSVNGFIKATLGGFAGNSLMIVGDAGTDYGDFGRIAGSSDITIRRLGAIGYRQVSSTLFLPLSTVIGTDPGGSALLRIGGSLFNSLGTITTAQQAIDSSVTWNSGATAFTGWKLNVTDTASAAGSLLLDLQVGGVSKFSVRKDGLGLLTLGGLAYAGANNGELWHDSTQKNLSCYVGGIRNSLVGCIFTSGLKAISGTSETTMFAPGTGTPTLPANSMVAGKMVRIRIKGRISTTGTYTLRIRFSIGGLMMDTSPVTLPFGTVTQEAFSLEADLLMVTPGAASTWMCAMMMQIGNGTTAYRIAQSPGSASNDTTISNAIDVTAQWGTSANLTVNTASVEILN